jgi:hypothetical protein
VYSNRTKITKIWVSEKINNPAVTSSVAAGKIGKREEMLWTIP